jgi:hypothetical protein
VYRVRCRRVPARHWNARVYHVCGVNIRGHRRLGHVGQLYCMRGRQVSGAGQNLCKSCDAGTKRGTGDDASKAESCISCAAGQHSGAQASACIECVAGRFVTHAGSDAAADCIQCLAGTYADATGSDETSDCIQCAHGKYVTTTGSNAASDCTDCAMGKYVAVTGSTTASARIDCAAGQYGEVAGGKCSPVACCKTRESFALPIPLYISSQECANLEA